MLDIILLMQKESGHPELVSGSHFSKLILHWITNNQRTQLGIILMI